MSNQPDNSRYAQRGVSASKSEVHDAIKHLDKGLFPLAFCKVLPDLVAGDQDFVNIMHADTAGTKTSLAYLYWKETGDLSVWTDIVQDAIVMNIDDMACTGCVDNIILSSTVGRNKSHIPGEVISRVINGTQEFINKMKHLGISLTLSGGETADVGDIVRTIDVGITAFGRLKRSDVVDNQIKQGDFIVGFSSSGQASYETSYNGGMGSNGLTSARHDVLDHAYADMYPESFDPNIDRSLVYSGSRKLTETINIPEVGDVPIGKLVLSPTRSYIPLIKAALAQHRSSISGMIHCTGGAQTKVIKFVENKKVIKDNLLPIPPLFRLIEAESGTTRKEMYQVFNMGHRLEIYCSEDAVDGLIGIGQMYDIDAQVIGRVEESEHNIVEITDDKGTYEYTS